CLHQAGDARALSSFPTRRSSDLPGCHGALWAEHLGELINRQACDPVVLGVDDDRESIDRHAKFGHLDAVLSAGIDLFLFDWARGVGDLDLAVAELFEAAAGAGEADGDLDIAEF